MRGIPSLRMLWLFALEFEGDLFRSRQLYESAAQQGSIAARNNLERFRRMSNENRKIGLLQLQSAAEDGDPEAIFRLAQLYHRGVEVRRDFGEAVKLYSNAASLGHKGGEGDAGAYSQPSSEK